MFSKQLKSVKFVTSKSFETHFYSFLDFSHLKSIFCEVPESILTITGNTWQFKTSLFWEQAFIFASWFDPIFDFNQSIYFGGNTLTIMVISFDYFFFFLVITGSCWVLGVPSRTGSPSDSGIYSLALMLLIAILDSFEDTYNLVGIENIARVRSWSWFWLW